jgi:hypothetical protein
MDTDPEPLVTMPPVLKYKKTANQADPLVNFQLNNPIPPIKRILKKLSANEEITIKIPVLTAIAIIAFGLGGASGFLTAIKTRLVENIPVVATIFPTEPPQATPNPWVATTLFGKLSKISSSYVLILENGNVVTLVPPTNVNLEKLLTKKILATGQYNEVSKEMQVTEASDLLLMSTTIPVPTLKPTPSSEPSTPPSTNTEVTPSF